MRFYIFTFKGKLSIGILPGISWHPSSTFPLDILCCNQRHQISTKRIYTLLVFSLYNERPILGDNPKAHKILLKSSVFHGVVLFTEKHCAFHEKRNERPFARNCNPMFYTLRLFSLW